MCMIDVVCFQDEEYSLNAHQDSGAIERWEDPAYRACYQEVFEGRWEDHDPWNADHRSDAKTDLYATGSRFPFPGIIFRAHH